MQQIKYYVLGKKNSELLVQLQNDYYNLLVTKVIEIGEAGCFKEKIEHLIGKGDFKKFLLDSMVSSWIHYIHSKRKSNMIETHDTYIDLFGKSLDSFLYNGKLNTGNAQYPIPGTTISIAGEDVNPYSMYGTHPDYKFNGKYLLGDISIEGWVDVYSKAFEILKIVDTGFWDELNDIIQIITPLGTMPEIHNSSTYKESIGNLHLGYMLQTEFPELCNLEAIIHESSHNKLNLIMHFDRVIYCNGQEIYYSAIRPDPRPIRGVFLGYHAFVPTMFIMMKVYLGGWGNKELLSKITLYYIKTKFLQRTIAKHARFTPVGIEIMEELNMVIKYTDILFQKIHPSREIVQQSTDMQKQHFEMINTSNNQLLY